MSDTINKIGLTLKTVAELAIMSVKDLATFVHVSAENGRIAYINTAKGIIALTDKVGEKKAEAALKAEGISLSTIKNARYMVRVYDAAVRGGHATESWFNGVHFSRAREFLEAFDKVGIKKLNEQKGLFAGTDAAWTEIALIAETGKVKSERTAASAKAAAGEAKADEAAGSSEEGGKAGEKSPANPLAEIETAMDALEALLVAFAPKADEVAVEKIATRLPTLGKAWDDARATVRPAKKAANA